MAGMAEGNLGGRDAALVPVINGDSQDGLSVGIVEDEPEPEFKHEMHWWVVLCAWILYLAQIVPCAVAITLYPLLYANAGFSEDDYSFLESGSIPWALKFIPGYVFESIWRPPRWVVGLLQLCVAVCTAVLAAIPLTDVESTGIVFYIYSIIVICHDTVFDGAMIRIFGKWGALLSLLQQFAYYFFDTVLCFTAVENFNNIMFLYIGIGCAVATGLLWVFKPWPDVPLVNLKGIWRDFRKTVWSFVVSLSYFINSTWSESMVPYFASWVCLGMEKEDVKAGYMVGIYNLGLLLGVSFGQYMFIGVRFRHCIMVCIIAETLGCFVVMFLHPGMGFAALMALHIICGIITACSDSLIQCYLVDSCDVTRTPTFSYSVFQSCYEAGSVFGFTVYPQLKPTLSWRDFWIGCCLEGAAITFVYALCFFVLPLGWDDPVLNRFPSLRWGEICEACQGALCGDDQVVGDIDKSEKEEAKEEGAVPAGGGQE